MPLLAVISAPNYGKSDGNVNFCPQGCRRRFGWSGFGQTTISHGKIKLHSTKTRVIFRLGRVVILGYSR